MKLLNSKIILYWNVLIVALLQPSTGIIYCDDPSYERLRTKEELISCQDEYRDYGWGYINERCKPEVNDSHGTAVCTALSLESHDTMNIIGANPKSIIFQHSIIKIIPSRLFEKYSSLQEIYINDSSVTEIDMNAFNGLTNLTELHLQNNRITEIGKGTFNSLVNLKTLDISNNQVSTIEKKSFHGLIHLEILNISHNKIENISEDMFDVNLYSLRVLNISHNFISTIKLNKILKIFSSDEQNLQLDFSYNRLTSFNISQLTLNLDTLNLKNNHLDKLDDLNQSISIKYLDLSNNRLSKFNHAPENIKYLNLSGNLLQDFNTSFSNDSIIETLDIGRNFIKSLNSNSFDNMSNLTNLCLKSNQLTDLPIGLFKNLKQLQILSLSGNHLKQFEFGLFSGLSNVLELDLSNNSFSNLDYKTFYSFKNLRVLNIANNHLVTLNPYDILNHCKNLSIVILNNNSWDCESLLNYTTILTDYSVQVIEGQNWDIKNHQGHACHNNTITENSNKRINKIDGQSVAKEINDLTKFFELDFRNSSFFHFFENYKNQTAPSQIQLDAFNQYFNTDFKNTSFYKYFNKNISMHFSSKYDESFQNLTNTLNLLNLKLSNLNQPNLIFTLPNSSQINFEKLNEVLSNFSNYFDSKFKSSNFYKAFNKNFTNLDNMNKPTVDLLNSNLEKFSKSVDDITNFVEKESSFYKLLQTKLENHSSDQVFLNQIPPRIPAALTSNMSYSKLTGASDRNQDVVEQIASLRKSFIAFMTILIAVLMIAMMLPLLKKFVKPFTKNHSVNLDICESIADLPLV